MTYPNDPAFSVPPGGRGGLTIREYFAAMAMSTCNMNELGFGTVGKPESPWPWVAEEAVKAADALIAELNKEQGV